MVNQFLVAYFCYSPHFRLYSESSDTDLEVDDNVVQPPKPKESRWGGGTTLCAMLSTQSYPIPEIVFRKYMLQDNILIISICTE